MKKSGVRLKKINPNPIMEYKIVNFKLPELPVFLGGNGGMYPQNIAWGG